MEHKSFIDYLATLRRDILTFIIGEKLLLIKIEGLNYISEALEMLKKSPEQGRMKDISFKNYGLYLALEI